MRRPKSERCKRDSGSVSQPTAIAEGSDEQAARLALDELRLALGNTRPNKFMIPCLAALICVMFLHWETPATLATWFAIVIVGLVPMQIVASQFLKREPPPSEMESWRMRIAIANAFFTVCWSSLAPLFWIHGDSGLRAGMNVNTYLASIGLTEGSDVCFHFPHEPAYPFQTRPSHLLLS